MEATVTLKLSVSELDTIRDALERYRNLQHAQGRNERLNPAEKHEARALEAKAAELLAKLR